MEKITDNASPQEILQQLAEGAIERLKALPQPVVRVSGPLTTGGYGYNENLRRFIVAQQKLREQGLTVFDYFEDNDDEDVIKTLDVSWDDVMDLYHQPILESGLITAVYMMPLSEKSKGATQEKSYFEKNNLEAHDIPEFWFTPESE